MKAHIRVRRFGSQWLAWSVIYNGEKLPLTADEPANDPYLISLDSKDKVNKYREAAKRAAEPAAFKKFLNQFQRDVIDSGLDKTPEKWINGGRLIFHESATCFRVDVLTMEWMLEKKSGGLGWRAVAEWHRIPTVSDSGNLEDRYVEILELRGVKKGVFPNALDNG